MAWDLEAGGRVTDFQELPKPGAVQYWEREWVPTLDGEPILRGYPPPSFPTRKEAWAEAIKQVKHQAGLAFTVEIDTRSGCVLSGGIPEIVESVAEAREVILRYAGTGRGKSRREADDPWIVRFNTRRGRSNWKSLLECETSRHYDPAEPEAGMTCFYLLEECRVEGVGGTAIQVTGPPEVWDHPTDQPVGMDEDDNRDEDVEIDTDSD